MKKLLVILVISLFPLCCIHRGNSSSFGVKAGLSYTTISGWRMTKYKTSGFIGGTYSIKMKNNWYFQPELLFSNIGANLKDDKTVLSGGYIGIYGIETPINLSYYRIVLELILSEVKSRYESSWDSCCVN